MSIMRLETQAMRAPNAGRRLPLCVDLDGTLIHSDTLAEGIAGLCADARLAGALVKLAVAGRAGFKHAVAQAQPFDPQLLPYNEALLDYLRTQKAAGRYLVLATAANQAVAAAVAAHLGLFDEVIASDETHNLKGPAKARALCERFGRGGFAYAGDSSSDLAVWEAAGAAVVVNASAGVARRAAELTTLETSLPGPSRSWRPLLRAMRPHQWLKNLLTFIPIFTAHAIGDPFAWLNSTLCFLAFCATASAIYLINDATDLAADRRHPRKRLRPIASGALSLPAAFAAAVLLIGAGAGLATLSGALWVVAIYAAMSISYSMKLKELPLVDVFMLAGLYTVRMFAGGVATGHLLSLWLLGFSGFLFLGLAVLKRVTELAALGRKQERSPSRRGYTTEDLPILQIFGCAASFAACLVLALFVQSEATAKQYASPGLLWGVVPLMLFWQCRLWLSTSRGYMHDDPIVYSGRDWVSWVVGGSVLSLLVIAYSVRL